MVYGMFTWKTIETMWKAYCYYGESIWEGIVKGRIVRVRESLHEDGKVEIGSEWGSGGGIFQRGLKEVEKCMDHLLAGRILCKN